MASMGTLATRILQVMCTTETVNVNVSIVILKVPGASRRFLGLRRYSLSCNFWGGLEVSICASDDIVGQRHVMTFRAFLELDMK